MAATLLDWLAVLALALIFNFVAVTSFLNFSYGITSSKKVGTPFVGAPYK